MIIGPEAEADLAEARAYYEEKRNGLGDDLLRYVEDMLRRIESVPEISAIIHRGVRRALTRRFPFSVYYRIEGDEIVVLAIVHSRRGPNRWQSRI